jgi:hypothetical protein
MKRLASLLLLLLSTTALADPTGFKGNWMHYLPVPNASAPNGSTFLDSSNSNLYTIKDLSGNLSTPLNSIGQRVVHVDKNRTDSYIADGSLSRPYHSLKAALAGISGASKTNPYLILMAPGNYVEAGPLALSPSVSIAGYAGGGAQALPVITTSDNSDITLDLTGVSGDNVQMLFQATFHENVVITRTAAGVSGQTSIVIFSGLGDTNQLTWNGVSGGSNDLLILSDGYSIDNATNIHGALISLNANTNSGNMLVDTNGQFYCNGGATNTLTLNATAWGGGFWCQINGAAIIENGANLGDMMASFFFGTLTISDTSFVGGLVSSQINGGTITIGGTANVSFYETDTSLTSTTIAGTSPSVNYVNSPTGSLTITATSPSISMDVESYPRGSVTGAFTPSLVSVGGSIVNDSTVAGATIKDAFNNVVQIAGSTMTGQLNIALPGTGSPFTASDSSGNSFQLQNGGGLAQITGGISNAELVIDETGGGAQADIIFDLGDAPPTSFGATQFELDSGMGVTTGNGHPEIGWYDDKNGYYFWGYDQNAQVLAVNANSTFSKHSAFGANAVLDSNPIYTSESMVVNAYEDVTAPVSNRAFGVQGTITANPAASGMHIAGGVFNAEDDSVATIPPAVIFGAGAQAFHEANTTVPLMLGLAAQAENDAGPVSVMKGAQSVVYSESGAVGTAAAFSGIVEHDATSSTISEADVFLSTLISDGGGAITAANGLNVQSPQISAGSTVGVNTGVSVSDQAATGVTTAYNIHSDASSAAYNLYATGTSPSFFAGGVGMGVAPGSNALAVSGIAALGQKTSGSALVLTGNGSATSALAQFKDNGSSHNMAEFYNASNALALFVASDGSITENASLTVNGTMNFANATLSGILQLPVQPALTTPACAASGDDGKVAITNTHIMCVCNGVALPSPKWVHVADGTTTCTF